MMPNRGRVVSLLVVLLWGEDARGSTYFLARWLFGRLLGLIYLIAFVSLWTQIHGLVGRDGVLPAADYLAAAQRHWGHAAYWRLPTLCWFSTSDAFLTGLCAAGTVLALGLTLGIAPIPVLGLLWVAYLSLCVVGQAFLSFQWDALLLETGFLAMFLAPRQLWPHLSRERPPPAMGLWLERWLLFKLMFLSGVTKLLSGDPTWRELTTLNVHYETQPLPTWIGWYAHQLPSWFGKMSVASMFVIELAVPFLIFAPRRLRHVGCAAMVLFQVLIGTTGNYCFFNLLTIALCVLLLDDRFLCRFTPKQLSTRLDTEHPPARPGRLTRLAVLAPATILLFVSGLTFVREMVRSQNRDRLPGPVVAVLDGTDRLLLSWAQPYVLKWSDPLRTINGYGLFRVMTTQRIEFVIAGSNDGRTWLDYELGWKPGDVNRRPGFVQPHQPRLDWQMWFAPLNPPRNAYWLERLMRRLLEGSPDVLGLFEQNPFPRVPPRFVRIAYYRYTFTDIETKRKTGAWWQRQWLGTTRSMSLSPP